MQSLILKIYQSKQTVFSFNELKFLSKNKKTANLKRQINYYVKTKQILNLRKGVYAKPGYNYLEIPNKIFKPSYISLETVLQKQGAIFQDYQTIFLASYLSRQIKVENHTFSYRKINDKVLFNPTGIEITPLYSIATLERAFLDAIFLYKDYHFDNLSIINWQKVFNLQNIYQSKILIKRVKQYYEQAKI